MAEIWKSRASELDGNDVKICLRKALNFGQQTFESRNKAYGTSHPEVKKTAELVLGISKRLSR